MRSITSTASTATPPRVLPIAGLAFAVALLIAVITALSEEGTEWGVLLVDAGLAVIGLALALAVVRAAERRHAGTVAGIVLSVLGLMLAPVAFWSGIPLIFGALGGFLGAGALRRGATAAGAIAIAIGALACIATITITVGDWLSTHA
jgi:hypothetical protein